MAKRDDRRTSCEIRNKLRRETELIILGMVTAQRHPYKSPHACAKRWCQFVPGQIPNLGKLHFILVMQSAAFSNKQTQSGNDGCRQRPQQQELVFGRIAKSFAW
jgi:hypothetical protein